MKRGFFTIFSGAACFLLAAVAGWKFTGHEHVPTADRAPVRPAVRVNRETRVRPATTARREMDRLRAISDPVERLRATMELAARIPVAEIQGWIEGRWFSLAGGFDAQLFRKILLDRWLAEDPDGVLQWAAAQRNSKDAFEIRDTMATADPERLLEFFQHHPDPDALARTLAQLANSHPALALKALAAMPDPGASEGSVTHFNLRYAFLHLAAKLPDELKAAMAGMPPAMAARAEVALLTHGLAVAFVSTLAELAARDDGRGIFFGAFNDVAGFDQKVLQNLAAIPSAWRDDLARTYGTISAQSAGRWLDADFAAAGFTPAQTHAVQARALSMLAETDPDRAIALFSRLDLGDSRSGMISGFFRTLSAADPTRAEALRATLTSPEEIADASRSISQPPPGTAATSPADWLDAVFTTGNNARLASSLASQTHGWDEAEKAALRNRFLSLPPAEKLQVAAVVAKAPQLGVGLRADAFASLVAQPATTGDPYYAPDGNAAHEAAAFAVAWSITDPAAAAAWVSALPDNENSLWVRKNLARNWSLYDPTAAAAWVDALPARFQTGVRDFMSKSLP